MFFYIVHNSPFWEKIPSDKRIGRTYMVGIVCYVLLHAFLFSKFAETKENLKLFRNYVYYMLIGDFIMLNAMEKMYSVPNNNSLMKQTLSNTYPQLNSIHPNIFRSEIMKNNKSLQIPTYDEFLKMKLNNTTTQLPVNNNNVLWQNNIILPEQTNVLNNTELPNNIVSIQNADNADNVDNVDNVDNATSVIGDQTSIQFPLYKNKKTLSENNEVASVNIPLYISNKLNDIQIPVYKSHLKQIV